MKAVIGTPPPLSPNEMFHPSTRLTSNELASQWLETLKNNDPLGSYGIVGADRMAAVAGSIAVGTGLSDVAKQRALVQLVLENESPASATKVNTDAFTQRNLNTLATASATAATAEGGTPIPDVHASVNDHYVLAEIEMENRIVYPTI